MRAPGITIRLQFAKCVGQESLTRVREGFRWALPVLYKCCFACPSFSAVCQRVADAELSLETGAWEPSCSGRAGDRVGSGLDSDCGGPGRYHAPPVSGVFNRSFAGRCRDPHCRLRSTARPLLGRLGGNPVMRHLFGCVSELPAGVETVCFHCCVRNAPASCSHAGRQSLVQQERASFGCGWSCCMPAFYWLGYRWPIGFGCF